MSRGVVVAVLALVALWASSAAAQLGSDSNPLDGRGRLRDRYEKPRQQQKLEDAIKKFNDDDLQTRLEGVDGLGDNAEDPKAIEYLLRGAADGELSVRVKSIDVIGMARVKAAVPLLVQELFMRDTSLATKQHILAALGRIGDSHATKPILDFLARDVDPSIRASAVYALGDLGDRTALPTLEKIAKDSSDQNFRGLAQSAIRKIEEKPAPSVVPPALESPERRAKRAEAEETEETE